MNRENEAGNRHRQITKTTTVLAARTLRPNWLPIPRGRFDVLLRVYGPEGNTSPGAKYVPPEIQP